jgi:hypothetical protein
MPRPLNPLRTPIATARCPGGTDVTSSISDNVTTIAPPAPWTARAAISVPAVVARAQAAEAAMNAAMPARKTARRPNRSPSAAAGSSKAANGSV